MSTTTRHALRVYTALEQLRGNDSDVLDALIPFFEPILAVLNGTIFDPHVFAKGVRRLYGWNFTGDVAGRFAPRLERKGYLERIASKDDSVIRIVRFQARSEDALHVPIEGVIEQIIDEFEQFPPRVTDLLNYRKSRDELKDMLVRFLVSMDSHGEGAFAPELGFIEPSGEARELLDSLEEGGRPLNQDDRYMCAKFVRHILDNHPRFTPHLTRLASIALLTEVVEDFLKPTTSETHSDLTIALDAPLALDFLGCSGPDLQNDIKTLVDALRGIGVSFIVFPDSCEEMQRNLRTMLSASPDQRYGYTHSAMIRGHVSRDFVVAVANNPERALSQVGIGVRQITLDTWPSLHRFFTEGHHEDFVASILWGAQQQAREHDASCLTFIMRLREGRNSSDIFKCKYVLVTRNPTFVRKSREYALQNRMINEVQEGPVVHQRELATTAWLRTGLGAGDAIPRGHLIASCDRVLQVRPELRQALAAKLARITPSSLEQLSLVMLDSRSVQKLADETLNNESFITEANAERLLQVMREATADELRKQHDQDIADERKAREEEAQRAKTEADSFEIERQAWMNERHESRLRAEAATELAEKQRDSVVTGINAMTTRIQRSATTVLSLLAVLAIFNYATGLMGDSIVWTIIAAFGAAFGLYRLIWAMLEWPTKGLATVLSWVARRSLERKLRAVHLLGRFPLSTFDIKGGIVAPKKQDGSPVKETVP